MITGELRGLVGCVNKGHNRNKMSAFIWIYVSKKNNLSKCYIAVLEDLYDIKKGQWWWKQNY